MQVIERERERIRTPSKDQQQERLINNRARSKCNTRYRQRERVWTPSKKQQHETLINNQARSKCNGGSYRQRD